MSRVTTVTGTLTRTISISRFEVFVNPQGGYVQFQTTETLTIGGNQIVPPTSRSYTRDFKDLPSTFPVVINGNTVQVAGSTILAALQSVADVVMSTQPQGPA